MNPTKELQYNSILISALPNKVIKEEGKEIVIQNLLGFFLSLSLIANGFEKQSPSDLS